jgi:hypothetical protein
MTLAEFKAFSADMRDDTWRSPPVYIVSGPRMSSAIFNQFHRASQEQRAFLVNWFFVARANKRRKAVTRSRKRRMRMATRKG